MAWSYAIDILAGTDKFELLAVLPKGMLSQLVTLAVAALAVLLLAAVLSLVT